MPDEVTKTPSSAGGRLLDTGILAAVLLYAAFSALWILLSDRVTAALFTDPVQKDLAGTLKDWLFVAVTSLLLYGLMRRLPRAADDVPVASGHLRQMILPMVLFAAAIVILTAVAIGHNVVHQKEKQQSRIETIAELKANQVESWLGERRADAHYLQRREPLAERYAAWRGRKNTAARDQLLQRLDEFANNYSYQDIWLIDGSGQLLTPRPQKTAAASLPMLRPLVEQAIADDQIHLLGPYRDADGDLHIDYIVSLGHMDAAIVLRIDPVAVLYPLLQSWPVPSASGEILIFRRDGDQALLLSPLRRRPDAALDLRLSLAEKDLLGAKVLRGEVKPGVALEGTDYRRMPVMGVVHPIAGTDWFLIAKMSRTEVYEEAIGDAIWIAALAGLLSLFIAAAGALVFRQRQLLAASSSGSASCWRPRRPSARRSRQSCAPCSCSTPSLPALRTSFSPRMWMAATCCSIRKRPAASASRPRRCSVRTTRSSSRPNRPP